jgi:hypothetical protein
VELSVFGRKNLKWSCFFYLEMRGALPNTSNEFLKDHFVRKCCLTGNSVHKVNHAEMHVLSVVFTVSRESRALKLSWRTPTSAEPATQKISFNHFRRSRNDVDACTHVNSRRIWRCSLRSCRSVNQQQKKKKL